jgi:hypothetical protein
VRRLALAFLAAAALAGCGEHRLDDRLGADCSERLVAVGRGRREAEKRHQLVRQLRPLLDRDARLPARRGSVLQYRVTGEEGEVRFADNSRNLPKVFAELIRFTRKIATEACGRDR